MVRRYMVAIFVCLLGGIIIAQEKPEAIKEQSYVGKALYGFMNGGSDLYYEYGFKHLTASEVKYRGEEFTVERYKMDSADGAFGIYSVHAFRCVRADTLNRFNCLSKYQLQEICGDEYISIVFQSGTERAAKEADELMQIYTSDLRDGAEKVAIPEEFLSQTAVRSSVLKLLKGPLAVNNIYSDFNPWVDGIEEYSVWLVEKEGYALFVLKNNADVELFKSRIPSPSIVRAEGLSVLVEL